MKRHAIRITGRVQGVFFRDTARQVASRLGLGGFARNEPDGSVYIEVEGDEDKLAAFLTWCRQGPSRAIVSRVTHTEIEPATRPDLGFTIY